MRTYRPRLSRVTALVVASWVLLTSCGKSLDRVELAKAFRPVCDGRGLQEAATYAKGGGAHPLIEVDISYEGYVNPGTGAPGTSETPTYLYEYITPTEWGPKGVPDAQLVACVTTRERPIEVCNYLSENGGASSTKVRYRYDVDVALLTARGADPVAMESFSSREPDPCPEFSQEEADLGSPPYAHVKRWLRRFASE